MGKIYIAILLFTQHILLRQPAQLALARPKTPAEVP